RSSRARPLVRARDAIQNQSAGWLRCVGTWELLAMTRDRTIGRASSQLRHAAMVVTGRSGGRRHRPQRGRRVLVNGLPFIVVLGMKLPVGTGDRLGRLVGLEAQVELLLARRTGG